MRTLRVLPWLVLLSSTAHADENVTLGFDWDDGASWRVVLQWELDIVDPKGDVTERSGVVREVWRWNADDQGHVLSVADTETVASPRDDALAQAIASVWEMERRVEVPAAVEVVEPPVEQPETPTTDDVTPEGEGGEVEAAAEAAPAVETAPVEEVAPAEETEPAGDAAPARMVPNMVALTTAGVEHGVIAMLQRLDSMKMVDGEDVWFEVADGQEVWTLNQLPYCPDQGPATTCVELTMNRYVAGATPESGDLTPGQGRFEAVWVLEPTTLVVHRTTIQGTVAYHDGEGDKEGTWLANVSRDLTFLDRDPPADLPPADLLP